LRQTTLFQRFSTSSFTSPPLTKREGAAANGASTALGHFISAAGMAKKRRLSPQSVYDEAAVQAAFAEAGVKDVHVATLYK